MLLQKLIEPPQKITLYLRHRKIGDRDVMNAHCVRENLVNGGHTAAHHHGDIGSAPGLFQKVGLCLLHRFVLHDVTLTSRILAERQCYNAALWGALNG